MLFHPTGSKRAPEEPRTDEEGRLLASLNKHYETVDFDQKNDEGYVLLSDMKEGLPVLASMITAETVNRLLGCAFRIRIS